MRPFVRRFSILGGLQLFALLCVAMAAPTPRYFRAQVATLVEAQPAPTLGNYPDTSLPLSTDTTVTPDATPTNTTSINVFSSTNFKGKLEGSPMTGVVRVTDAHPAGTYTVTVIAFNGAGPATMKTFTLTVTAHVPATCNPVRFAAAANFGAGSGSSSVAVGDFNGDGKQDLVVANFVSNNVSVLLGDGAGNFSAPTNFGAGSYPSSVAVGDFNGDGKQDLVVANLGSSNVSILLGDGIGNFSAPTNFGAGTEPRSVAVGEFNGDGKQDLAVANQNADNVSILLGDGIGNFSAPTNFGAGSGPISVAVGDFNGDDKQDLAVANYSYYSGKVSVLLGDGMGNFSAANNFPVGSFPRSVAVGDFNGDGKQDLATSNNGSNNVSILLGDGAGNFSATTTFGAGSDPWSVAAGDFDGDGKQDLAVANWGSSNVSIFLGDGTGNFSAPTNFSVGSDPFSVAVGDFNGDGKQDLAVANSYSNNVSILLRNCALQLLNISARMGVQTGNNVLIGGLIIAGTAPKNVAVRGIGPSLGAFGVLDALADPTLELRGSNGALILANDDWQSDPSQAAQLTALGLALQNPKESGLVTTIPPGSYTAVLAGKNQTTGVGLVEIYDTNQAASSQLANISTRGFVLTGNNVMIGGFILRGDSITRVAVRGIGPSLARIGLNPVLADPTLELHDGNGTLLVANDDWLDDPASAAQLRAFGVAPTDPKESGIFVSLPPGSFTAILAGKNGGTGIGLIEVYNVH